MNRQEGVDGKDEIHRSLRAARIAFAGFGMVELAVAVRFHKVALGVDGAHNIVDVAMLLVNSRARQWAKVERHSFLTCVMEPGAPLFSSATIALTAMLFTGYELASGAGTESYGWLAVVLLAVSLVANVYFALRLDSHEGHDAHSRNAIWHLFLDAGAALIALIAYMSIAFGASDSLDVWAALGATTLVVVGHFGQIMASAKELRRHMQPGHTHPLTKSVEDEHDDHESDHARE